MNLRDSLSSDIIKLFSLGLLVKTPTIDKISNKFPNNTC